MYQIKCDDYVLYDPRDDDLVLFDPKCKLKVNTVGEASFTIYASHPYFDKLRIKRSIFEISQDGQPIFRGRMTSDSRNFDNAAEIDIEGVLSFLNDSIVRPFQFPGDFVDDPDYQAAAESGNVIEFFLAWLLDNHNTQVQDFQRFKVGHVTVSDPNNYITRSSNNYRNTWKTIESALFGSGIGGYLCIRYENDGNYIDYLSEFEYTNTQRIRFGENLLDILSETDGTETYTAVIPLGSEINASTENAESGESGESEESGETGESGDTSRLKIDGLPDGNFTDDIIKSGDTLYSKSAVDKYGWIYAPIEETTWNDVTIAENLLKKGAAYLSGNAIMLSNKITIKAADLHFSDSDIETLRIYRNIIVESEPHGESGQSELLELEIDVLNPQNTIITVGRESRTMTQQTAGSNQNIISLAETVETLNSKQNDEVSELKSIVTSQETNVIQSCESMILSALDSYVETGNYTEFKETVEAQLSILSDEIVINFTTTQNEIADVDGTLEEKFAQLYKYISYSGDNAITIGSSDSAITLTIDNETGINFMKNGETFGTWDGDHFYTGNIVVRVNERAQFGNFAFVPRSDGSLSFLKVGE